MAKNLPKKPQVFVIFLPAGRHAFGGMILTIGLALLAALQQEGKLTEVLMLQEELKTMPFGAVWDQFCESCGAPVRNAWYEKVQEYEKRVLEKRV